MVTTPVTIGVTVHVAVRGEPDTGTFVQRGPFWSAKVTVPSGRPAAGAVSVTVAVNVYACPRTGEAFDVTRFVSVCVATAVAVTVVAV